MPADMLDALVTPTLKHLRERWWDDEFTEFLAETLKPRPGNRILDVGCGEGQAQVALGRLHISQIQLVGIDLVPAKVVDAKRAAAAHNHPASFAAGDACRLPFRSNTFDSIFCVAVLQHITDVASAVAELARVARPGGRILAVEPDNTSRYAYSSLPSGRAAFAAAERLFGTIAAAHPERGDRAIGPQLPELYALHGIEPVNVRLFPVSQARLGMPATDVWERRQASAARSLALAENETVRRAATEYAAALETYQRDAAAADGPVVEIQHMVLFATLGQRSS